MNGNGEARRRRAAQFPDAAWTRYKQIFRQAGAPAARTRVVEVLVEPELTHRHQGRLRGEGESASRCTRRSRR